MGTCDLQICFMNEIASDDELDSEPVEAATTAEALLRANISQKVGQIIVPMEGKVVKQRVPLKDEQVEEKVKPLTRQEAFQQQVVALQAAARHGLVEARATAQRDLQLNRRTLSRLNVAQLQLIQN